MDSGPAPTGASRNDGVIWFSNSTHDFAISPRVSREFCWKLPALGSQRAQGRPGARCTRGLVHEVHKRRCTRAYRSSGSIPAFPAQWFYGFLRALPGGRPSCHRRPQEACFSRTRHQRGMDCFAALAMREEDGAQNEKTSFRRDTSAPNSESRGLCSCSFAVSVSTLTTGSQATSVSPLAGFIVMS
jgi:hypothetical protein